MAASAARQYQPAPRAVEASRATAVCRVHKCLRCSAAIASTEPCSFLAPVWSVCSRCKGQEQVLAHLPASRCWGAALARVRR